MAKFLYSLTLGQVPLLLDSGTGFRSSGPVAAPDGGKDLVIRKYQPCEDIVSTLNRIIPFHQLNDLSPATTYPGKNLGALAWKDNFDCPAKTRIGEWYYPTGASRFSVFRGLATSTMVKQIQEESSGGPTPLTFTMKAVPQGPGEFLEASYTLSSLMYVLPPRPLAEHGGRYDGLFLITLVDERYYGIGTPCSLTVSEGTTWDTLLTALGASLGLSLSYSALDAVYGVPEPDSQLWANKEDAAVLLDAVACNLGRVVVRDLDGTYHLYTHAESYALAVANRGNAGSVVRTAGGDIFYSGSVFKTGSLVPFKNSIVPGRIDVTFPKYVYGDDPIPHFVNSRYSPPRPSTWYEDSYGDVLSIGVGISSGTDYAGSTISGLTGIGSQSIRTTAKALYAAEGGDNVNASGLTALAMRLARDRYDQQALIALDEVYPGTFAWALEGFHDVIWTYSARARGAFTRVQRGPWNNQAAEMQHGTVPQAGGVINQSGVGGKSVPLAVASSGNPVFGVNYIKFSDRFSVTAGTANLGVQEARVGGNSANWVQSGDINSTNLSFIDWDVNFVRGGDLIIGSGSNIYYSGVAVFPITVDGGGGFDWNYYRRSSDRYYYGGMPRRPASASIAIAPLQATIYAAPLISVRGGILDQVGVRVTAEGGNPTFQMGIYHDSEDGSLFPGDLYADLGEQTVGVVPGNYFYGPGLDIHLAENTLYWLVWNGPAAPGQSLSMVGLDPDVCWPLLGSDAIDVTSFGVGWNGTYAYAAGLPAAFPDIGITIYTGDLPAMAYLYSSFDAA